MSELEKKFKDYLNIVNPSWIIAFTTVFLFLVEIFLILLFHLLNIPQESNLPLILPHSLLELILLVIIAILGMFIIAPIAETFIFQYLFYEGMCVKYKLGKWKFVFFSAAIFGLVHLNFLSTIIITFIICFGLNYLYATMSEVNRKNRFVIICFIHSLLNISVVILKYLPYYF